MGIYDRDYVFRRSPSSRRLSFNAWIIIVNCVVFFGGFMLGGLALPVYMDAQVSDPNYDGRAVKPVGPYLTSDGARAPKELLRTPGRVVARELVYAHNGQPVRGLATYRTDYPLHALGHFSTYLAVFKLEVWRLVTFQFLHANVTHLLFNMIGLYMFGGMVEQYLGSKRYLAFYLACGICGGLGYLLLNLAGYVALEGFGLSRIPGLLYNQATTPLVGASAGVFGVILACAYISPNSIVQLIFPPIPMKLRTMAYVYVGIAVAAVLFNWQNAGGEAAHLGGALAGFFLIRNSHLLRDFFDVFSDSRKAKPRRSAPVSSRPPPPDEAEVDRILAKIREHGIHALSSDEKDVLRRASQDRRSTGSD
jgi:membrane associated rhomboid family serine protease